MAYVCKTLDQATASCLEWVEQLTWVDQLAITREQAIQLLTPIAAVYVVLIAWAVIMEIYHQNK